MLNVPLGPDPGNGGTRSSVSTRVLDEPALADLNAFIEKSLQFYFDETFKPLDDVKLRVTQSWTNYTLPGQYHDKHSHQNSLVSGVFYISAQKDQDNIFFVKDAYDRIRIPAREHNVFNALMCRVPVGTGELLLFPSSLPHVVEPTMSGKIRVSLAFNSFPEGVIGDERLLTGLSIGKVR